MKHHDTGSLPAPPPITAQWLRYVLIFGVSVAVGLAPYLGKLRVPLFSPLLSWIPVYEQDVALTLSSAAMGIVALVVQWYGTESLAQKKTRKRFFLTLATTGATFLLLVTVHTLVTVPVQILGSEVAYFVVGPEQPHTAPCEMLADSDCLRQKLTLNRSAIETHFGQRRIEIASMELVLAYVAFTSSFAWFVGVVLLKKDNRKRLR